MRKQWTANLQIILSGKLLKSLASSLGNQPRGAETEKHEQSKDLHDVVQPRGAPSRVSLRERRVGADGAKRTEDDLSNDGTDLSGSSRDTVGGGAIASGEALSGNDEGRGVGAGVEEELSQGVQGHQSTTGKVPEVKSDNAEEERLFLSLEKRDGKSFRLDLQEQRNRTAGWACGRSCRSRQRKPSIQEQLRQEPR